MVNFTAASRSVSGRFVASPPKRKRRVADATADEHNSPSTTTSSTSKRSLTDTSPRSVKSANSIAKDSKVPKRISVTRPHGYLTQTNNVVPTTPAINENGVSVGDTRIQNQLSSKASLATTSTSQSGKEEKRVLRSKYGPTRSRSAQALIQFFPDYEQSMFGPPKEPGYITIDSTLFITNKRENVHELPMRGTPISKAVEDDTSPNEYYATPDADSSAKPSSSFGWPQPNVVEELDFTQEELEASNFFDDPLPDSLYLGPHKKAERHERSLRNIEKVCAQAEKMNLARLLEGLKGPDWLKTMGISGITDSEKRKYEPKRDYYIKAVQALYNKFDWYKDQVKELEQKRGEGIAARGQGDAEASENGNEESVNEESDVASGSRLKEHDQSAPQVLQQVKPTIRLRLNAKTSRLSIPSEPGKPFTSFYSKQYLREAAVGKHRRGRSVTAFGQLIPDTDQKEFALPKDLRSEEAATANARKRRRFKRHSEEVQNLQD